MTVALIQDSDFTEHRRRMSTERESREHTIEERAVIKETVAPLATLGWWRVASPRAACMSDTWKPKKRTFGNRGRGHRRENPFSSTLHTT